MHISDYIRKLFLSLPIVAAVMVSVPVQAADIAGFKLGMTVEEAKEVAKAMQGMGIKEEMKQFSYFDGAKGHVTDPYVATVIVSRYKGGASTVYALYFATPPQDNTLVYIRRRVSHDRDNMSSNATFREALIEKYGTPSIEESYMGIDNLNWALSGSEKCFARMAKSTHIGDGTLESIVSIAKRNNPNISECGLWVQYGIKGDPVSSDTALMVDLQRAAKMLEDTQAWITGLEAEARKALKEKSKSNKPSL